VGEAGTGTGGEPQRPMAGERVELPQRRLRVCRLTVAAGNDGLRPRPFAITPTPALPRSTNRRHHRRTASASTPQRRAISSFASPSAAHNNARACSSSQTGG
jgi:hypothetical protein